MTEQEAIKILNKDVDERADLIEAYNQANIFPILIDKIVEAKDELEAFKAAILALEKQIPEQVSGNVDYYTCKCGAIVPPMERYCQDCGQRLKWRAE